MSLRFRSLVSFTVSALAVALTSAALTQSQGTAPEAAADSFNPRSLISDCTVAASGAVPCDCASAAEVSATASAATVHETR